MLAKQAWRLIHNTHSLFYQVYKSRYFPNCSFMDVEIGSNLSYVCRSLLTVEILLRKVQNCKLRMEDILKFQLINGWHITQFFWERFSPICWWRTWFMMPLDNVIETRCLIFLLTRHAWKFCCSFALKISFCTKCLGPLIAKESFQNVQMLLKKSSCYFGGWWTNILNKSWKDGRWWLG